MAVRRTYREAALVAFLFVLAPCIHAQTFIQNCGQDQSGVTTMTCFAAMPFSVGANHLIVITAQGTTTGTMTGCTSLIGITYTVSQSGFSVGGTGVKQFMAWGVTQSNTGSEKPSCTFSSAITGGFRGVEFANVVQVSPVDGSVATNSGTGTCVAQTDCTITSTTTNAFDMVVSVWYHATNSTVGACCVLTGSTWSGNGLSQYFISESVGSQTSAITDGASGTWGAVQMAFKLVARQQSVLLIQETVSCTTPISTQVVCVYQNPVQAGNSLVIGMMSKRGSSPIAPFTIADTLNIAGTSGWHCQTVTATIDGAEGTICDGFPTSSGSETVTFTTSSILTESVGAFASEWSPALFAPCTNACTLISGSISCCGSGAVTSIPVTTSSVTGYVNNFSIAILYGTFPNTCAAITWTSPKGTPYIMNDRNAFIAYSFQPTTSGSNISMTMHCGTGDTGAIVWGGLLFSSTYSGAGQSRRSQVY